MKGVRRLLKPAFHGRNHPIWRTEYTGHVSQPSLSASVAEVLSSHQSRSPPQQARTLAATYTLLATAAELFERLVASAAGSGVRYRERQTTAADLREDHHEPLHKQPGNAQVEHPRPLSKPGRPKKHATVASCQTLHSSHVSQMKRALNTPGHRHSRSRTYVHSVEAIHLVQQVRCGGKPIHGGQSRPNRVKLSM